MLSSDFAAMLSFRIKPKLWKDEPVRYKQVKMNGHRCTVVKNSSGEMIAFGRNNRMLNKDFPHIEKYEWWNQLQHIPNESVVDGEIYVPGGTSSDVTNQITIPDGKLHFSPFAVPLWSQSVLTQETLGVASNELWSCTGLNFAKYAVLSGEYSRESLLKEAEDLKIEGWVLKWANNEGWYKLKPIREMDVFVTGFTEGRGKFLGAVGALKVSCYLEGELFEIAKVSGMDDLIRWEIDEDCDLNRVCEVRYQDIGSKGRLIHPRFVCWRDDKTPEECRYERDDL